MAFVWHRKYASARLVMAARNVIYLAQVVFMAVNVRKSANVKIMQHVILLMDLATAQEAILGRIVRRSVLQDDTDRAARRSVCVSMVNVIIFPGSVNVIQDGEDLYVKIYVQWVNMVMIVNRIAVVKMAAHAIRKQAIVTVALVGPDQYVRIDVLSDSGA